jgi:L-lactate dehydrogenase
MQVAVVGLGNVGCALLHALAGISGIDRVLVMSRQKEAAMAAILDVAGANPRRASKMSYAPYESLSEADIIVVTAGVQIEKGQTAGDTLKPNIKIADTVLSSATLKKSAILICLASPVDYLTVHMQKKSKLPRNQVFGFGGDLDRNRLEYVLRCDRKKAYNVGIVGEHGANAIPVYEGEAEYAAVAQRVRKFLSTITAHAGQTRNLATGELLGKLVQSIVNDSGQIHYVCGYHAEQGVYLTWPFLIGRKGIVEPVKLSLQPNATGDLDKLRETRISRIKAL